MPISLAPAARARIASLFFNAVGDPTPDRCCLAYSRSTVAAGAERRVGVRAAALSQERREWGPGTVKAALSLKRRGWGPGAVKAALSLKRRGWGPGAVKAALSLKRRGWGPGAVKDVGPREQ